SVYKAIDLELGRQVAVKILSPDFASHPDALQRFERAAVAAAKLIHPNIVSVHEFVKTEDSGCYLVTDWVDGLTLEQFIAKSGPLLQSRGIHIFTQVCDALMCLHKAKVIHRNLKPGNIVLTTVDEDRDFVKLMDFGIAKALPEQGVKNQKITQTGH